MSRSIPRLALVAPALLTVVLLGARPAAAQEADLALVKSADHKNVKIGENITFTITVTNLGPNTATGIVFGDPLPDPLNLVSFSCGQGSPSGQSFCAVASLPAGLSVTATLVATPIANPAKSERSFSNTAFVSESATPDPNPANNSSSLKLHIAGKI